MLTPPNQRVGGWGWGVETEKMTSLRSFLATQSLEFDVALSEKSKGSRLCRRTVRKGFAFPAAVPLFFEAAPRKLEA